MVAAFASPLWGLSVPASLAKGLAKLDGGQFEDAVGLLEEAARESPQFPQTYRFLTKAYEGTWDWEKAAECCDKLVAFGLRDAATARRHAGHLRKFAELSSADLGDLAPPEQKAFQGITQDSYAHSLVRYAACERLGRHHFSSQRPDLAQRYYDRLAKAPTPFRTNRYLSDCATMAESRGDLAAAARLLGELTRRAACRIFNARGRLADIHAQSAKDSAEAGKWSHAEREFAKARQFSPTAFLFDHVEACVRTRRFQKAVAMLEQALVATVDPGDEGPRPSSVTAEAICTKLAGVCVSWAEWLERRGQFGRAAELYRKSKEYDPNARPCLSSEQVAQLDEKAARPMLDEAVRLIKVKRQYRPAFRKLQALVLNFPGTDASIEARYHMGMCYWWLRQFNDSAKAFRSFYEKHPDHRLAPSAWMLYIRVLVSLCRFKEAAQECDKLVAAHQDHEEAVDALYYKGVIQGAYLRDDQAAVETFESVRAWYPDSHCGARKAPKMIALIEQGNAPWRDIKVPEPATKPKWRGRKK